MRDAILSGIWNDLGSGSNVDVMVIRKDEVKYHRNLETPNDGGALRRSIVRPASMNFPRGATGESVAI